MQALFVFTLYHLNLLVTLTFPNVSNASRLGRSMRDSTQPLQLLLCLPIIGLRLGQLEGVFDFEGFLDTELSI